MLPMTTDDVDDEEIEVFHKRADHDQRYFCFGQSQLSERHT